MNIFFKKQYSVRVSETVVRHETDMDGFHFSERIQRSKYNYGTFDTREEAEKDIRDTINEYEVPEYKVDDIKVEKDLDKGSMTLRIYSALNRNFFPTCSNKQYKRKTKPYFTIYKFYTVCEEMNVYGDDEDAWKKDVYADASRRFEEPEYRM